MDMPQPTTKTLVANTLSASSDEARRRANQEVLEKSGHVQPIPMTVQGLQQLRSVADSARQVMSEQKIPLALQAAILSQDAKTTLAAWSAQAQNIVRDVSAQFSERFAEQQAQKVSMPAPM